jgi:hypothetical protein
MECGDIEDIDVSEMTAVTIYPCKCCGYPLECIDGVIEFADQ